MKLIYAICLSMILHFAILYTPILQGVFSIEALGWDEWMAVLWISAPVILIDEVLKAIERAVYVNSKSELKRRAIVSSGTGLEGEGNGVVANGKMKAN